MASLGTIGQTGGVDPGQGHGHHAEVDVVCHGMGIARLAAAAIDFLFEFLKAGLDLPTGGIELNDIDDGQGEIGSEEGYPLRPPINPDNAYQAFEEWQHGQG